MIGGNESTTSSDRMISSSRIPNRHAAMIPSSEPSPTPMIVAISAHSRITQPPSSSRLSTLRPSTSVPRASPEVGSRKGGPTTLAGGGEATKGPTTATPMTAPAMATPTRVLASRSARPSTTMTSGGRWPRRRRGSATSTGPGPSAAVCVRVALNEIGSRGFGR